MSRKKSFEPAPDDRLDRLTDAIEGLTDEIHVLRVAIDELREQYDWSMRHREELPAALPFVPLTSLPRNPLAADFGERINGLKPQVLTKQEPPKTKKEGELF